MILFDVEDDLPSEPAGARVEQSPTVANSRHSAQQDSSTKRVPSEAIGNPSFTHADSGNSVSCRSRFWSSENRARPFVGRSYRSLKPAARAT